MNNSEALKKLFSLHNFGVKLGLENTINFLEHIGNPQKHLRTIHIAGSNGKGSTASFIASILQESGLKTGLYTSPHFVKFNERIVIDGNQINDEYITDFLSAHESYIDKHELTFFEVTTSMAFKYFHDANIDICVIETGLGGRLDSTNVLSPIGVVITSISYEHTAILGNKIEQIATEKAAIIKNGSKVFTGRLPIDAEMVIRKKAEHEKCNLYSLPTFLNGINNKLNLLDFELNLDEVNFPLKGSYQKNNAALAALAVKNTIQSTSKINIVNGIENVVNNTKVQGRYEYFNTNPTIIFDSAHNPEGVENFVEEFKKERKKFDKRILLFGAMQDKATGEMLKILSPFFDEINITEIDYERSAKLEFLIDESNKLGLNAIVQNDAVEFVANFINNNPNQCLVVLGSIYLVGAIKAGMTVNIT